MASPERRSSWMVAGALVWALHFAAIYGYTGYACARGLTQSIAWAVGAATLVAIAMVAVPIVHGIRRRDSFDGWITAMLGAAALLAIVWEAAALLGMPPCAVR